MAKDIADFLKIIKYNWMLTPILFIILEDKGGVGKSLIAQVIAALLRFFEDKTVQMIDTDFANSTTAQVHKDTKMIDLDAHVARGIFVNIVKSFIDKIYDFAVVDVGARQEKAIKDLLPWLVAMMRSFSGLVIVIRPLTTGTHNLRNSVEFMTIADELSIPTVFVKNLGQGRGASRFDRWDASKAHADALALGAAETFLPDGDVTYVDESIGFGLSIANVALADFSKVEEDDKEEAKLIFDADVCAFLNLWLRESMLNLGGAIEESIAKRAARDAVKAESIKLDAAQSMHDAAKTQSMKLHTTESELSDHADDTQTKGSTPRKRKR